VPHGFAPPSPSLEVFSNLQGHIRRTGLSFVAVDDGTIVGYGSSWTRGDDWFLASLFIAPPAQGRGAGPALLDAVWSEAKRRRTMTDAIQPISNVLYGRRGLVPATPSSRSPGIRESTPLRSRSRPTNGRSTSSPTVSTARSTTGTGPSTPSERTGGMRTPTPIPAERSGRSQERRRPRPPPRSRASSPRLRGRCGFAFPDRPGAWSRSPSQRGCAWRRFPGSCCSRRASSRRRARAGELRPLLRHGPAGRKNLRVSYTA